MLENLLSLGTAKMDITPSKPVQLAGFQNRPPAGFDAIDSCIYARIFYFKQQAEGGNVQQVIVISAELLCWENELVIKLKARLSDSYNIPREGIILHATHSHSGPSTMNFIDLWDPDPEYIAFLQVQIIEGAGLAMANAEHVTVERGLGDSEIAVNRRKKVGAETMLAANYEGLRDPELQVIQFKNDIGDVKAALLHYTCHPVLTSENRLSYEFCGAAVECLEQQFKHNESGNDVIVGFLQGCCGDINPTVVENLDEGIQGFDVICEKGKQLAESAWSIINHKMVILRTDELQCSEHSVELPFQHTPTRDELENIQLTGSELEIRWATHLLQHPEKLRHSATLWITQIKLATDLNLLFMNGEIVVSYGLFVKELSGGNTLPIAYSNGNIGYVTTAKQLEEGGYEPVDSVFYYGLPAPYDCTVESIVLEKLKETMGKRKSYV